MLDRLFAGKLGRKTITSAVVLVGLVVLRLTGVVDEAQFSTLSKLAEALGLVGIRDAIAKSLG